MNFKTNPLIEKVIAFNKLDAQQIHQLMSSQKVLPSNEKIVINVSNRFLQARDEKQKIFIYGDYDCDGLCSTSILVYVLRAIGCDVGFYIPNRFKDGYGVTTKIIQQAFDKGYQLFVMVDNGVSAFDEIQFISNHKCESIIIDHHQISQEVKADYLLHPNLLSDYYVEMCASGLSHLIAHQLIGYDPYCCALAGLATIGDMMPVWNYNRDLLVQALKEMNEHRFLTFTSLLKNSNDFIDEEVCAFQIVPKLNAVGRLADIANPNRIIDFLLSTDAVNTFNLALQIIAVNENRKKIHEAMYKKALKLMDDSAVIMVKDSSFHEGVVGITAGQLSQQFKKVAIVMHDDGNRLKGSARSYGEIDLRELFAPALDCVERYGGHRAAAGIEMSVHKFDYFKKIVNENMKNIVGDESEKASIVFNPEELNISNLKELLAFAPFGMGFTLPLIKIDSARIHSVKTLKRGVKLTLSLKDFLIEALDFNLNVNYQENDQISTFYARFKLNSFRGNESVTFFIEKN